MTGEKFDSPEKTEIVRRIPQFFALDFDRCLGDVDKMFELSIQAGINSGLISNRNEVDTARSEIESAGGTFDFYRYIADKGDITDTDERTTRLIAAFDQLDADPEDLLLPGARMFLDYLSEHNKPHAILTYGETDWQIAKMKKAGLGAIQYQVMSFKEKGKEIATWWDESIKGFRIPSHLHTNEGESRLIASTVTLIDDKAAAFIGLPDDADGYQVVFDGIELIPSQEGPIPKRVHKFPFWRIIFAEEARDDYGKNVAA